MSEQDTSARLRHEACHIETDETLEHVAKLMRGCAYELDARQAEIERLRGELADVREDRTGWVREHRRLVAERDALRVKLSETAAEALLSHSETERAMDQVAELRARIAEAEGQEPIAWLYHDAASVDDLRDPMAAICYSTLMTFERSPNCRNETPLYARHIPAPAAGVPDAITQSAVEALEHLSGACLDINLDRHTLSRFAAAAANACRKSLAAPQPTAGEQREET